MRAQITKRRVAPYPVIEEFNELEDRYPGRLAAKIASHPNLTLQSRDEALGNGVVQGRAHPTHRWHDSRFLQPLAKRESCVLRSPIAMVDESRRRVPPVNSHLKSSRYQFTAQIVCHRLAHHPPGVDVEDEGQVEEAFIRGQMCNVRR